MKKLFFVSMAAAIMAAGCAGGPRTADRPSALGTSSSLMEWSKDVPGAQREYHYRDAHCTANEYYGQRCSAQEGAGSSYRYNSRY